MEEEEPAQPKALKVPPEVKPKPQSPPPTGADAPTAIPAAPASPRAAAATVSSVADHDDDDEGDKIMAELQVGRTIKGPNLPVICTSPHALLPFQSRLHKHKQTERDITLLSSGLKWAAKPRMTNSFPHTHIHCTRGAA